MLPPHCSRRLGAINVSPGDTTAVRWKGSVRGRRRAPAPSVAQGSSMRIVLYTGKGGVGKTTVAAATAVRCAELGYRTVVLSTDLAHSLADSFDRPLAPEPIEIAPNLWAQETDI